MAKEKKNGQWRSNIKGKWQLIEANISNAMVVVPAFRLLPLMGIHPKLVQG
jgi:hypothetical protein